MKITSVTQLVDNQSKGNHSWNLLFIIIVFISQDHMSSKQKEPAVAIGGTFAGVGDFTAVSMTTTALNDNYSNLVKDHTACIRLKC